MPNIDEKWEHDDNKFNYASDLVTHIRSGFKLDLLHALHRIVNFMLSINFTEKLNVFFSLRDNFGPDFTVCVAGYPTGSIIIIIN